MPVWKKTHQAVRQTVLYVGKEAEKEDSRDTPRLLRRCN